MVNLLSPKGGNPCTNGCLDILGTHSPVLYYKQMYTYVHHSNLYIFQQHTCSFDLKKANVDVVRALASLRKRICQDKSYPTVNIPRGNHQTNKMHCSGVELLSIPFSPKSQRKLPCLLIHARMSQYMNFSGYLVCLSFAHRCHTDNRCGYIYCEPNSYLIVGF